MSETPMLASGKYELRTAHSKPNDAGVFIADFVFTREYREAAGGPHHFETHRFMQTVDGRTDLTMLEKRFRTLLNNRDALLAALRENGDE